MLVMKTSWYIEVKIKGQSFKILLCCVSLLCEQTFYNKNLMVIKQNNITLIYKTEVIKDLPYCVTVALHPLEVCHDTYKTTIHGKTQLWRALSTVPDAFTQYVSEHSSASVLM